MCAIGNAVTQEHPVIASRIGGFEAFCCCIGFHLEV